MAAQRTHVVIVVLMPVSKMYGKYGRAHIDYRLRACIRSRVCFFFSSQMPRWWNLLKQYVRKQILLHLYEIYGIGWMEYAHHDDVYILVFIVSIDRPWCELNRKEFFCFLVSSSIFLVSSFCHIIVLLTLLYQISPIQNAFSAYFIQVAFMFSTISVY